MLSIITPVYNVSSYLPATIESILGQSYRDFELILIDDGSSDNSYEICRSYASEDSRIRLVRQANKGVSAARNLGVKLAKGEIIGFVDGDDLIEPDMYQLMIYIMNDSGADIVQCCHDRTDKVLNSCGGMVISNYHCVGGSDFIHRMFTKTGGEYTNQIALWSKIYKKELFEGVFFPVGQTYEDEHETYKICFKAYKIAITDAVLYHYISRENSIITGVTPKKMLDKQNALCYRVQWMALYMPDLYEKCLGYFNNYSKHIICQLWKIDKKACDNAIRLLLMTTNNEQDKLSIYDRFYYILLNHNICKKWILKNDFVPIQNFLSIIKKY